jgi:hypothetical protein
MQAMWLEGLVWDDVRSFLHAPGEVLERAKEQNSQRRRERWPRRASRSLAKGLTTKQDEKDLYVRLYAAGHLDEEEINTQLADVGTR